MKIILANGIELIPHIVSGGAVHVQNANRDALTFIFNESYSMDALDELFSEENCEVITIVTESGDVREDGTEIITTQEDLHKGYTIRVSLTKKLEMVAPANSEADETTVTRIEVTMAQRTYTETQLVMLNQSNAVLMEEMTNTQLALCEMYENESYESEVNTDTVESEES